MTSHDSSARADTPELPEAGSNQTDHRATALADATDSPPSEEGVGAPAPPEPERDLATASRVRMNVDRVVGTGERFQTPSLPAEPRVPAEPSVRIGKSIPVGGSRPAEAAVGDVARGDDVARDGDESARGEQTVCRRRPAQYAVLFATESAAPSPSEPSRRPLLLAGLVAALMVAGAGYAAMSKREASLAPHGVTSLASATPQAEAAAGDYARRADEASPPRQLEGVSHDEQGQHKGDPGESARSYTLDLTVEPSNAWIMLDGKTVGMGHVQRRLRVDGVEHTLVLGAPGYEGRILMFRDAPPPAQVALEKRVAASSPSMTSSQSRAPSQQPSAPRRPPVADAPDKPRRGANGALILR